MLNYYKFPILKEKKEIKNLFIHTTMLQEIGKELKIDQKIIYFSFYLFHHYIYKKGDEDIIYKIFACLFIGCKTNNLFKEIIFIKSEEYFQTKNINFDKKIISNYEFDILDELEYPTIIECPIEILKRKIIPFQENIFKYSIRFLNDSFRTSLCLYYSMNDIIINCIHLTFLFLGNKNEKSYNKEIMIEILDIYKNNKEMESIKNQII